MRWDVQPTVSRLDISSISKMLETLTIAFRLQTFHCWFLRSQKFHSLGGKLSWTSMTLIMIHQVASGRNRLSNISENDENKRQNIFAQNFPFSSFVHVTTMFWYFCRFNESTSFVLSWNCFWILKLSTICLSDLDFFSYLK